MAHCAGERQSGTPDWCKIRPALESEIVPLFGSEAPPLLDNLLCNLPAGSALGRFRGYSKCGPLCCGAAERQAKMVWRRRCCINCSVAGSVQSGCIPCSRCGALCRGAAERHAEMVSNLPFVGAAYRRPVAENEVMKSWRPLTLN